MGNFGNNFEKFGGDFEKLFGEGFEDFGKDLRERAKEFREMVQKGQAEIHDKGMELKARTEAFARVCLL